MRHSWTILSQQWLFLLSISHLKLKFKRVFVYGTGDSKKIEHLLALDGAKERTAFVSIGLLYD